MMTSKRTHQQGICLLLAFILTSSSIALSSYVEGRHVHLFVFYFSVLVGTVIDLQHTLNYNAEKFVKGLGILNAGQSVGPLITVTPKRITRTGDFIEYATIEALSVHQNGKVRRRRSVEQRSVRDELDPATITAEGDHEVFFDLGDAPGSPLSGAKLHLKKNYKLVSKNFVVEERSRGGKIVQRHTLIEDCHYKGVIHNHDSFSKVALSLCNGLQGIIVRDDDTFFIEPVWNHTRTNFSSHSYTTSTPIDMSEQGHPHMIFKRSVVDHLKERRKNKKDLGHCGYSDKVAGETPWWKIDPRNTPEKNQDNKKTEEDHRKHHHGNHRTDAGRSKTLAADVEPDIEKHRTRRSISTERFVETMVVADKKMVLFHGRKEVERFLLTIMNIVAGLYHDATIGNAVNIIVTRVVLLTEDQPGMEINHRADYSLDNFCKWQSGFNINGTGVNSETGLAHHDNAILITGLDICTAKNAPCPTLGLAPVSGMCGKTRSCSINEDIGLASAFTIAHEIGHNFGMQHDGSGNGCGNTQSSKIMAPQMTANTMPFMWSRCSKKYITDFLDDGSGDCLLNTPPQRYFNFSAEMAGQLYDADEQCRLQYGAQSKRCHIGDICRDLWCTNKHDRCATNNIPAAEGTNCQTSGISRGWCYRGQCVPFGLRPKAVDGSWGSWSAWAECSRTCGTGISASSRSCDSPVPENGGKYCIGERRRYRSCNTQPCTNTKGDLRREQCARFDTEIFNGRYFNWLPFTGANAKPCALTCLAQGYNFYAERAPAVIDGTRCFSDSLDVCINGECHHVGCDHVLHSNVVEDKCRVCGGDGSTCETQAGVFNDRIMQHGPRCCGQNLYSNAQNDVTHVFCGKNTEYHQVVTIPRGSVNILIQELEASQLNYIALKNSQNEDYINGGWIIDWPQNFKVAGTTFIYKRPTDEAESLEAVGPTTEDVTVMLLVQEANRGLRFEYNVPIERHGSGVAESAFLWELDDWTPCSVSCAGGTQRRLVKCKRVDDDTVVQHSYCNQHTMPVQQEQSCNVEPCPSRWSIGKWNKCSRTCGGGHRIRKVVCMRLLNQPMEEEIVDQRFCTEQKPSTSTGCNPKSCPPEWTTGHWSSCKPRCGDGHKTRVVTCKSSNRSITYPDNRCNERSKPTSRTHCNNGACPPPRWQTGKWSSCSVECGQGIKKRRVICVAPGTGRQSHECPKNRKPKAIQTCSSTCGGPPEIPVCVDGPNVAYCPLVKRFRFCHREYFRKMCCQTCSRMG